MTASHMIFGACALSPLMILNESYSSRHAHVIQNDWKGLSIIAVMNGFQIACNNASLTVMELSMNQAPSPTPTPALMTPRQPAHTKRGSAAVGGGGGGSAGGHGGGGGKRGGGRDAAVACGRCEGAVAAQAVAVEAAEAVAVVVEAGSGATGWREPSSPHPPS